MIASAIEKLCAKKGLRMSRQREIVARVLSESTDYPNVQQIHKRALNYDSKISIATVYRTMRLLKDAGIAREYDFGDSKARYEENSSNSHDHLVDINSGKIIKFQNKELRKLQDKIAQELGYNLIDYKLEIYAKPISQK